jgi:hypothetical protein
VNEILAVPDAAKVLKMKTGERGRGRRIRFSPALSIGVKDRMEPQSAFRRRKLG